MARPAKTGKDSKGIKSESILYRRAEGLGSKGAVGRDNMGVERGQTVNLKYARIPAMCGVDCY